MSKPVFRQKSLDKMKSPDHLNEYIRVASPGIWIILIAILVLLAGFCIWSVFGSITTTVHTKAHCENGVITCDLPEDNMQKIHTGMEAEIGQYNCTVSEIVILSEDNSYCTLSTEATIPDGVYDADIIVEAIHPASFLTN